MDNRAFGGPYVQVAGICQTSIMDNQGALSVIRFQDRIHLAGFTDEMQPQALNHLQLVLALRSGDMRGKATLQMFLVTPSGNRAHVADAQLLFEGDERGNVSATPLAVTIAEEGLHYLELMLDGTLLTRILFRVLYQKLPVPPGMQIPPQRNG